MRCSHKSEVKLLGRTRLPVWPFVDWLDLRLPAIYGRSCLRSSGRSKFGSGRTPYLGERGNFNPVTLAAPHRGARDPGWKYTPATQQPSSCRRRLSVYPTYPASASSTVAARYRGGFRAEAGAAGKLREARGPARAIRFESGTRKSSTPSPEGSGSVMRVDWGSSCEVRRRARLRGADRNPAD
jgi:hypothetical protein